MEGITKRLARFVVETDHSIVPDHVFEHAKYAFLDYLTVLLEGASEPLAKKLVKFAETMGGAEQATIPGGKCGKKSVSHAALINGAAAHALDYDDTLLKWFGHPSVTLFPSLMALSEWQEKSGLDFLTAYLVGIQVGSVVGASAGYDHYMKGWHNTSTIGHFGSAAACAKLLGLNLEQTVNALGIAGTRSAGLKQVFGTMCKPYHAGMASEAGLIAALLAQDGFDSASDILEGKQGFFHCLEGTPNEEMLASLGRDWEVVNLAQKYHASCHATHSPIEAAMKLVRDEKIDLSNIETINLGVSSLALDVAAIENPTTALEGKFSIIYCVANALLRGITDQSAFTDEKVNAPEVRAIMGKINLYHDGEIDLVESIAKIETKDGRSRQQKYDIMKQIPPLELKAQKLTNKFFGICNPILGQKQAKALHSEVIKLENVGNMKTFIEEQSF